MQNRGEYEYGGRYGDRFEDRQEAGYWGAGGRPRAASSGWDEEFGRGRQQWERFAGGEDIVDRGMRREDDEAGYGRMGPGPRGEPWRRGEMGGRGDYGEEFDERRGMDFERGGGYGRSAMTSAPQGYDRGFGQDYGRTDYGRREESGRREGYGPGGAQYGAGGLTREGEAVARYQPEYTGPHTGRGPKGYRRGDERIREDVCEALGRHGEVDASEVEIQVRDGEVTLTGTVEDRWQKRAAEDALDGISGVRDVHNQLRVQQGQTGQRAGMDQTGRATTGASAGGTGATSGQGQMADVGREGERAGANARSAARSR